MKAMMMYLVALAMLAGATASQAQEVLPFRMLPLPWEVTPLETDYPVNSIISTPDSLYITREGYGLWMSADGRTFQPDCQMGGATQGANRVMLGLQNELNQTLWLHVQMETSIDNTGLVFRKELTVPDPRWTFVRRLMSHRLHVDSSADTTRYYAQGWQALSSIYQYTGKALLDETATKFAVNAQMRGFSIDAKTGIMYYYANQHVGVKDGLYRLDPSDIRSPERLPARDLDIFSCYQLISSEGILWLTDNKGRVFLSTTGGSSFVHYFKQFSQQRHIKLLAPWPGGKVLAFDEDTIVLLLLSSHQVEALYGLTGSRITAVHRDPYRKTLYVATKGTNRSVHGEVQLNSISFRELALARLKAKGAAKTIRP